MILDLDAIYPSNCSVFHLICSLSMLFQCSAGTQCHFTCECWVWSKEWPTNIVFRDINTFWTEIRSKYSLFGRWAIHWAYSLFAFWPYSHHHHTVRCHLCIRYPRRTDAIDFSCICVFIWWLLRVYKPILFILCVRSFSNTVVYNVPHFCGSYVQQTSRFGPTCVLWSAVNVCSKSQKLDASEN